jgi:Na+/proline symporter
MNIAGHSGKLNILDFSIDPANRYTFWSGITGGLFLALSYFGTDQSQVQRYLSGQSIRQSRLGLIFNGLLKVPMQFFILLVGVMVFVFYQFVNPPVFFNKNTLDKLRKTEASAKLSALETKQDSIFRLKAELLQSSHNIGTALGPSLSVLQSEESGIRNEVRQLVTDHVPEDESNDKDYVFISFILAYLPKGLIGLLLAVIFSAAMSSTSSELSALATTTTVDIYKRIFHISGSEEHYVTATRLFTIFWGLLAILFACFGSLFENLIQFVNIIGSLFYGTILGIFLVAFYFRVIQGKAIFYAAIISELLILLIYYLNLVSYLWLNVIGCVLVIIISHLIEFLGPTASSNYETA